MVLMYCAMAPSWSPLLYRWSPYCRNMSITPSWSYCWDCAKLQVTQPGVWKLTRAFLSTHKYLHSLKMFSFFSKKRMLAKSVFRGEWAGGGICWVTSQTVPSVSSPIGCRHQCLLFLVVWGGKQMWLVISDVKQTLLRGSEKHFLLTWWPVRRGSSWIKSPVLSAYPSPSNGTTGIEKKIDAVVWDDLLAQSLQRSRNLLSALSFSKVFCQVGRQKMTHLPSCRQQAHTTSPTQTARQSPRE